MALLKKKTKKKPQGSKHPAGCRLVVSDPPGRDHAQRKTRQATQPRLTAIPSFPHESSLVRTLPLQTGLIPSETLKGYFLLV